MSNRYRNECPLECKVFVGNLSPDATRTKLEDVFSRYGRLRNVWLATNPPGFAFVMFEDSRDAQQAVRRLNDTKICGRTVTVEMSTGYTRRNSGYDRNRDRFHGSYDYSSRTDRYRSEASRRDSRESYRRYKRYSESRSRSVSPKRHGGSVSGTGDQRINSRRSHRSPDCSSRSKSQSRD